MSNPSSPEKQTCPDCEGTGKIGFGAILDCPTCNGTGYVNSMETTSDPMSPTPAEPSIGRAMSSAVKRLQEQTGRSAPYEDFTPTPSGEPIHCNVCGEKFKTTDTLDTHAKCRVPAQPLPSDPKVKMTIDPSALEFTLEAIYGKHEANAKVADMIRKSLSAQPLPSSEATELEAIFQAAGLDPAQDETAAQMVSQINALFAHQTQQRAVSELEDLRGHEEHFKADHLDVVAVPSNIIQARISNLKKGQNHE